MNRTTEKLGPIEGTALYLGAVLGPGVMVLPALAAAAAGPASILSWLALLVLSVPVAATFAALGARHPDGGGVATFFSRAFGPRAAVPVGWCFCLAVPVGVLAGALVGGEYLAAALGLGDGAALGIAAVILAAAFGANLVGLHLSGRIQLVLAVALAALLLAAVVTAAPHARAVNFNPFLPYGWASVGTAATVLFYAFSGWEAAIHLSGEFRDPRRHLPRVTAVTLAIVTVLYAGLSLTTIGVLGPAAGADAVPLSRLLAHGFGAAAQPLTAVAAVALSFVAVNTYIAGGARLGVALARDGALPRRLATLGRSLAAQAVMCVIALLAVAVWSLSLDALMRVTAVCLAAVSCAGMVAALRLLPPGSLLWWGAVAGVVFTAVVLAFCGWLLLIPLSLVAGSCLLPRGRGSRLRSPRTSAPPPGCADRTPAGPARSAPAARASRHWP